MMALAPRFQVKGCHRARRPMRSGDGLLVRIRPRAAALSVVPLKNRQATLCGGSIGIIAPARRFEIKDWRPGARRPMQSGVDLLAALPPRVTALSNAVSHKGRSLALGAAAGRAIPEAAE
jgi:hypothetical protein